MSTARPTVRRTLSVVLVTATAGVLAAGCGDDSKSSTSSKKTKASAAASTMSSGDKEAASKDIVDTAVAAGSFTTLVAAAKAAGLEQTLRGDGPFTVFAPNDDAFAKLPEGTVEDLLKPENKAKLAGILTYHVVSGAAVQSSDLTDGQQVTTVQGGKLAVSLKDGVTIGTAKVVTPDIESSNGVIHVIDTVLLPPEK